MKVTGSITTSVPIPPDVSNYDISGILSAWTFFDGVRTISHTNGAFLPSAPPLASTDASGNITFAYLLTFMTPMATSIGETDDTIWVFGSQLVTQSAACLTLGVDGFCSSWTYPADYASSDVAGTWTTEPARPIPTMSSWSVLLLILLLGTVGYVRLRLQIKP